MMRFAMRSSTLDPDARAALYATTIEMCEWAESRGGMAAVLSQHHGVDDGYLPSPIPLAAAIAARTGSMPINVAALLLALYEPVKLAEDLAVVDLISRGRVSYIVGIGYRAEEFAMFGVDRRQRAALVEDSITLLRRLWSGEDVEIDGRRVRVTPQPYTPGGPPLAYGGGTEAAARRAARLGLLFMAETHDATLEQAYRRRRGCVGAGLLLPAGRRADHRVRRRRPRAGVGRDRGVPVPGLGQLCRVERDRQGTASISRAGSIEEMAAEKGAYQILTPAEARGLVEKGIPLGLQPLVGGLPPDLAWPYLEAAAAVAAPTS